MKKVLFMVCFILVTTSTFASKTNIDKDVLDCEAEISIGYGETFVRMKVSGTCAEVEAYIKRRIKGGWKLFNQQVVKKETPKTAHSLEEDNAIMQKYDLPFIDKD
jgi:hypothetical protein